MYPSILLSVLAATTAFAAQAVISLDGRHVNHENKFEEGHLPSTQRLGNSGPYNRVELDLKRGFHNINLRCQLLNSAGRAILVNRGDNKNKVSFGDGNKGPWTFPETRVSFIKCDAALVNWEDDDDSGIDEYLQEDEEWQELQEVLADPGILVNTARVALSSQFKQVQRTFNVGKLPQTDRGATGPFDTVSLRLDADVQNQALRCSITDGNGKIVPVTRGGITRNSFAAGSPPWKFRSTDRIGGITCNP